MAKLNKKIQKRASNSLIKVSGVLHHILIFGVQRVAISGEKWNSKHCKSIVQLAFFTRIYNVLICIKLTMF